MRRAFRMRALLLGLLLMTGCATPVPVAMCPGHAQPNAITAACTQLPKCKRNCYVTLTAAYSTGSGSQSVTSSDSATMTENRSNTGPLP